MPLPLQHPNLLAEKGSFAPTMATVPLRDFLAQNLTDGIGAQPFFRNRWHALTDAVLAETDYSALPTRTIRQHHILSLGGEGTGVVRKPRAGAARMTTVMPRLIRMMLR